MGVSVDYEVSSRLTIDGGLNYIMIDKKDGRSTGVDDFPIADRDQDLINLYLGFSYKIKDNFYLTGSYNWTDHNWVDSDAEIRSRAVIGVRVEF